MSVLTGIQTGPRQLELPPNIPVFDSAGRYWTGEFLVADPELERMIQVVARERPDAVRPEELVLVEQVAEHALQLLLVENRQEPPALVADEPLVGRRHVRRRAPGWRFRNSAIISMSFGWRVATSPSNTVEAQSGSRPTIDRTFSRIDWPLGSRSRS